MLGIATALVAQASEVSLNLTLPGILALAAGILILILPTILNYIVAIYLIVTGAILVFDIRV
ncbi:MAG TPA: DUF3096 domain-containing protein [Actinomycetota bacterium]|nr:DUF3096 domain-containing protein [Actinomycetota bacterium]